MCFGAYSQKSARSLAVEIMESANGCIISLKTGQTYIQECRHTVWSPKHSRLFGDRKRRRNSETKIAKTQEVGIYIYKRKAKKVERQMEVSQEIERKIEESQREQRQIEQRH